MKSFLRISVVVIILLCVLSLLFAVYINRIEPYWIEVNTHHLPLSGVSPASGPITIMQLSDTHFKADWESSFYVIWDKVFETIARVKPDLIVLTGDYLDDTRIHRYRNFILRMGSRAPVYAVQGNFMRSDTLLFKGLDNAHLLSNTWKTVVIRNTTISLIGVDFHTLHALNEIMPTVPVTNLNIVLCHTPDILPYAQKEKIDLILTGHTHGGQVCLPFYGAVITLTKLGTAYASGLFQEGKTWLYVNKGLGCEVGNIPNIRFLCRPEIAIFHLEPITAE